MATCAELRHHWKQARVVKRDEEEEGAYFAARNHSQTLWKLFQEDLSTTRSSISRSRSRLASFADASFDNSCGNGNFDDDADENENEDEEEDDSMPELEDEEELFPSPSSSNDSVNKPQNCLDRRLVGGNSGELFPSTNVRQDELVRTLHRSCESINQMIRTIVENAWNSRQKTTIMAADLLARREETLNHRSASIILSTSSSPSPSLSSLSSTFRHHSNHKSCGSIAFPSSPAITFQINKNKHSKSMTIAKMAVIEGNPEEMDRLWQDYNDAFPDHSPAPPPPCNLLCPSDFPSTSKPSIDQDFISNRVKKKSKESHSARADSIPSQIITHAHNLLHQSDSPLIKPLIEQNSISSRIKEKSKESHSTTADSIPSQISTHSSDLHQSDSPLIMPLIDQNSISDRTKEKPKESHSARADLIRSQIITHARDLHLSDSPSTIKPSIEQDSILNRINKKSKESHSKRANSIQSQITTTEHDHHQSDFQPTTELSVNQGSISNRIKESSKELHSRRADSIQSQIITTSCNLHQSDIPSTIKLISVNQDSISNRIKERSKELHGKRADLVRSQITTTVLDHHRSDFPSAIELSINQDSTSSRIKKSSEESHSKGIRFDSIRSQILTTAYNLHHQPESPLLAHHCKNKSESNVPAFPSLAKIKTKKKSHAAASLPTLQGKKVIVIGAYWGRSSLHGLCKTFRKCFPHPS